MCGIVGYIGNKNATQVIINGLKRLEYRGYDSAGIALLGNDEIFVQKKTGKIKNLEALIDYRGLAEYKAGIGHTRWATHGAPSDRNSHPHIDCSGDIAIVHNGIIENYLNIKE